MAFVLIGLLLGGLKLAEIGPFTNLSWWWVVLPFVCAVFWWQFSDSIGLTQKRAMRKMEERKAARRERDMEALGLNTRREKRLDAIRSAHARAAEDRAKKDA